jgi:EmrB/QacA subfamily drug resistance transporter
MRAPGSAGVRRQNPWPALWALCLGFFMILVDTTIVAVATPSIMDSLEAGVNQAVWVTSAYLLAYAVPLLVAGRLGDRFGPKNVYLAGLTLFTASSVWCGLSGSVVELIVARVLQGFGASMMTPQTMAVITRTFPANNRGQAMGVWGSVAGAAKLVGPVMGGLLIASLGWEWIFFINVPVGVIAFVLAWKYVPALPVQSRRYDVVGIALSAVGMFCLVFGIHEGHSYGWGGIVGPISVWSLIITGVLVIALFLVWQGVNRVEPLLPLGLFADRNFSLANVGVTAVGFAVTAMAFPLMLYAQSVRGLSPVGAALLLMPMALISGVLAPFVGKLVDRSHPRLVAGFGLLCFPSGLVWLSVVMTPGSEAWVLLLPIVLLGVANAFVWSPLSTTATRNLPMHHAGAGAAVYNTTRLVGSVLGSASMAVVMQARLTAELDGALDAAPDKAGARQLPAALHEGFAQAMAHSLLLPAGVLVLGFVAVLFFARPRHMRRDAEALMPVTPNAG